MERGHIHWNCGERGGGLGKAFFGASGPFFCIFLRVSIDLIGAHDHY